MVLGQGVMAATAREAIEGAYLRGEGDEFIQPTVLAGHRGIASDEAVLFTNFRSDRVRQLSAAFGLDDFDGFDRGGVCLQKLVCMTEYDARYPFPVLFSPQTPGQVLAEVLSDAELAQLPPDERDRQFASAKRQRQYRCARWLLRTGPYQRAVFVDYAQVASDDALAVAVSTLASVLGETLSDAEEAGRALSAVPTLVILDNLETLAADNTLGELLDAALSWSEAGPAGCCSSPPPPEPA